MKSSQTTHSLLRILPESSSNKTYPATTTSASSCRPICSWASFAWGGKKSSESRNRTNSPRLSENPLLTAQSFPQLGCSTLTTSAWPSSHSHVPSVLPSSMTIISVEQTFCRHDSIACGKDQSLFQVGIITLTSN